jgi:hypothetical protein
MFPVLFACEARPMNAFIAALIAIAAPQIHVSEFTQGKTWAWDYYDDQNQLYSTERYKVLSVTGNVVTIEMATEFPSKPGFVAHHRFEADVDQCLHSNKTWKIRTWYKNGSAWEEYTNPKTAMFEEKFNCLPEAIDWESTIFGEMFQTRKNGGWYAYNGVAFEKKFQGYYFRMR